MSLGGFPGSGASPLKFPGWPCTEVLSILVLLWTQHAHGNGKVTFHEVMIYSTADEYVLLRVISSSLFLHFPGFRNP